MALPELQWQIEDYFRILRIHKGLILLTSVLCGGFMAFTMSTQPDIYQATTQILINVQPPQVVQFQEIQPYFHIGAQPQSFFMTEIKIIMSRPVLTRVVEELNLASFPPFSEAKDPVDALGGMISVELKRGTRLVEVSATGTKPDLVYRLANGVADTYARHNLERRQALVAGGAQWLREEVAKMEEKMRTAQLALQDFLEKYATIDFSTEQQNTVLQRIQALNAAITETRERRIEAETKYRERHPILRELRAKERELERALHEQEEKALQMSRLGIQYAALERDAKVTEGIYNTLLGRSKELMVQEGMQANNVQVIEYAQFPEAPIGPPRARMTLIATLGGFLLGCGLALVRARLSKVLQTRQDFEQLIEIPFLGYIPLVKRKVLPQTEAIPFLLSDPKSPFGEAVRSVRTTLEFLLPEGKSHALLISSALPGEGKSLVCANLAVSLHELGRKVLLIDGDMRRPVLHRIFATDLEPGLSGFLQGSVGEAELVKTASSPEGLRLITAGMSPPQPPDLLNYPLFPQLINKLKTEFQYILIDSPPVLVAADAAILASLVDGTLYIIRADRTHREAALVGKQRLLDVGAKLIGGVLNGARLEWTHGYRYYYAYRYYKPGKLAAS